MKNLIRRIQHYPKWTKEGYVLTTIYEKKEYRLVQYDNISTLYNMTDKHLVEHDITDTDYVKKNLPQFLMESLL